MDRVCSETNEENENIERTVRRRHSSILKPPRSPLQDLKGGNDAVQDSNVMKNRKSSRRVSFADTIKIFQTESHVKISRKSEIAGMNTLLCAPIQNQMQQKEFSIIEHNHERKPGNDQTIIFSDENQMDLTASHTVMIAKDLLNCTQSEKSTKIDTKSFLANLKLHSEDSKMKNELNVSMDQDTSSEKKINFNDFIKKLKMGKSNSPSKDSDKENCEPSVHANESNNASSIHQMHVSLNVDEDNRNRTRIFREQDDVMNFTQCHTANIQTLVPISYEASLKEVKGDDITIYGSEVMDLTINHTIQILPTADHLSEMEIETQNVRMDVTSCGDKSQGKEKIFKNKLNTLFQDSTLSPEDEIQITRGYIVGAGSHTVTQTSNQDVKNLPMTLESICSSSASQDYNTLFNSSCNDAMELTKCVSSMRKEENVLKHDSIYSKMCPNSDAISLIEKTFYFGEDSMDITKSHTVAIDNHVFKQDETNLQKVAAPISEKEKMLQNCTAVAESRKMNVNCSSVLHIPKKRLQQSLTNSLSIPLTDRKTELFTDEDMDLTKCHTGKLGSQTPLASYDLAPKDTSKCHSSNKRLSDKWDVTEHHIEPSPQPNVASENIVPTTWDKEKHHIFKMSFHLDKDSPQSIGYKQNIAKAQNIISGRDLDKQVALGNNRNVVSWEQSLFSAAKPLFLSERQALVNNHITTTNSHTLIAEPDENSKLPEPLRKSLGRPTTISSDDRMVSCSAEEQTMDLTKSHTVAIGCGPSEAQIFGSSNLEHANSQLTIESTQMAVKVEKCNKTHVEKTETSISNDTEVIDDKLVQKPGFLDEKQSAKTYGRKSVGALKMDKTIVFSESDQNDMDITKNYTIEISKRPLSDEQDSDLVPLPKTSRTILYTRGQDDMEMTRSLTTALECKTASPEEVTTKLVDKTVMFVDNHDLEMTKCHTVLIDYQGKEKTMLPIKPNFELPQMERIGTLKVISDESRVFFPEVGENDPLAVKGSQLTVPGKWSNRPIENAVACIGDENIEMSKSVTRENDKHKPGFLKVPQSDKNQRRKSLKIKNDKTIIFSESNNNNMDITRSCMVEVNHKSAQEDQEDSHLMPMAETSKTGLYACGQDDMEMTRSHTTALECKTASPEEVTTRLMDKTVMFRDNCNDLEVTKSHTVYIDYQAMEEVLPEGPKFGLIKEKNFPISFPKEDNTAQKTSTKQVQAIENKMISHPEQKHPMVPFVSTKILSGDGDEMETTKFHSTYADEEVMEKVVDSACMLGKTKIESCRLNRADRRNVDLTSSHAPVTCGSSDKCCLPDVISYVDNVEENIVSLCDKEEAINHPVSNDIAYANDLAAEYYLKAEQPPISVPYPLLEKTEVTQTDTKGQLDSVITLLTDQEDVIKDLQNVVTNPMIVGSQDLEEITKLSSKRVSFKLPNDQMEDFVDNEELSLKKTFVNVCAAPQPHFSTQLLLLPQEAQNTVSEDETILSKAGYENLNAIGKSSGPTYKNKSTMLNNEKQFTVAYGKELKENMQTVKCGTGTDLHSNSDLTNQVNQIHANLREPLDTVIASYAPSFSTKQNQNNKNGKTEGFSNLQIVHIPPLSEQLLDLANKAPNDLSIVQAIDKHNINIESSNAKDDRNEHKNSHNVSEINSVSLMTVVKDANKTRKRSLGIFLPRLPNKRSHNVTGTDDLEQIPADTTDLNHLKTQHILSKNSGIASVAVYSLDKLNLSPSQYINEENLPVYPEINSSDSINVETEEKTLIEIDQKGLSSSENDMEETQASQKRASVPEDDGAIQSKKQIRKDEVKLSDAVQDQQVFDHHTEGDMDKNANSTLMKSLTRTPPSCSSSLDSIKGDGASLDFSTHRSSQMESQFLRDTICEEGLREKLMNGRITIKEFFILLQVHILIQKPRQSNLPTKFTINTPPTPEDLMLTQYVYRPKIQIYKEDCEALHQKIEELKLSALNQDKLLSDVNKNLWGKMRHYSDEELKAFGIYLNKIKSRFTKITKVFTHQGKVALYSKLVQSAQSEREKLQIKMHEMNIILKEIDNCLTKVEIETKYLEDEEKDNALKEWDSKMRAAEKELKQLKTHEEELQRNILELQVQKQQMLAQIDFVKKQTNKTEELLDQLSLSEWDIIEWSDDQAVFTFLYDTIELTITFGEAIVGLPFLAKDCRKITDLNFQSILDEDKAPPSSLLVHKLIFQYIEEQDSWKKKCTAQHQVSQMLQEISLVVNHCRLLGEEIEFLKRWGPNYNLMNIDINNTELKLLFSSSVAFAKFEITLSLSAHYPFVLLPFSIQIHLGNTGQDEIAAILSNVPLEGNYLKNVVKQIYRDLLQNSHCYQ
ncbi:kinetochore scaffold 1 [Echinops telfairi]|uniref:Kinetochore scaffold 1 n=1 Tax=Echinops telfairi TaxID=9371 RepID=A0ABM0ZSW3_ECHTE|nr:kinetochore scaffold 1 [Echinops telfairi]